MFRVGMKVTPVASERPWISYVTRENHSLCPEYGKVYVILAIQSGMVFDKTGLKLTGLPDIWWDSKEFRPVVEKKTDTDISIFTSMLTPAPKVREEA